MTSPIEPIIVAEHVSKRYAQNESRTSLRHEFNDIAKRFLKQSIARKPVEPFWALRDVSFTVPAGQTVGIVGRNGSGKSTLFRTLCGITHPTEGYVSVRGRFSTLIALGAGFNQERSGRENIYLSAAIQGVPPREIEHAIHDIIEFAELGQFIDLPVKRYSSGMYARLGFSIAVHLKPDILFVDEILAVGDAAFQDKCIERILEMKASGLTMLIVTHQTAQVMRLCDRAIWLHKGRMMMDGDTKTVMEKYHQMIYETEILPTLNTPSEATPATTPESTAEAGPEIQSAPVRLSTPDAP
ncbi:MAG: ABC transporter ATP-binding protein [Chloroflexi bacterium]|nr:ABC transporter ATP-binding protein [Chloroflexota bacterium]NOG62274.1 ABC transporter ATP-binding protein [Chloroflexota bacterium]